MDFWNIVVVSIDILCLLIATRGENEMIDEEMFVEKYKRNASVMDDDE